MLWKFRALDDTEIKSSEYICCGAAGEINGLYDIGPSFHLVQIPPTTYTTTLGLLFTFYSLLFSTNLEKRRLFCTTAPNLALAHLAKSAHCGAPKCLPWDGFKLNCYMAAHKKFYGLGWSPCLGLCPIYFKCCTWEGFTAPLQTRTWPPWLATVHICVHKNSCVEIGWHGTFFTAWSRRETYESALLFSNFVKKGLWEFLSRQPAVV